MHVIVTDALPPTHLAATLGDALASRHPDLIPFFNGKAYQVHPWSIDEHGCTPKEAMLLQAQGFVSDGKQPIGRALANHLVGEQLSEPVWVADMCSILVGQNRTALLPLEELNLDSSDAEKLSASASILLDDPPTGLRIEPIDRGRWRVTGNLPPDTLLPSPAAVADQDLADWWPTGDAWRPWRKLVNELQMLWHMDPVNEARTQAGLTPVNGLWLYGGGGMVRSDNPAPAHWIEDLSDAATAADWSAWLDRWQLVKQALMACPPEARVTLTAPDRLVHLAHAPVTWWRALFRVSQNQQWRKWWQNSK